jgi:hypothetical protein
MFVNMIHNREAEEQRRVEETLLCFYLRQWNMDRNAEADQATFRDLRFSMYSRKILQEFY